MEIKNLGVNFADILGMRKTLTTIDCWYVYYSILLGRLDSLYLPQVFDNPTKHRGSYAARTYAPRSVEGGEDFPSSSGLAFRGLVIFVNMAVAQVLPTLAASTPSPCIFSTVMAACTDDDEKLVASALLVASTLQKHLGLLERIEAGKSLRLADGSPLLGLLEKVTKKVLNNLSLCTSTQIPDILDRQFLLNVMIRLKKGGASLAEIFNPEVSQHEGLGEALAEHGDVQVAAFAAQESLIGTIEVVEGKVEEVEGDLVPIDNPLYNKYTEGIAKKVRNDLIVTTTPIPITIVSINGGNGPFQFMTEATSMTTPS